MIKTKATALKHIKNGNRQGNYPRCRQNSMVWY